LFCREKRKHSPEEAEKAWKGFFQKFPEMQVTLVVLSCLFRRPCAFAASQAWEITFNANQDKSMEDQLVEKLEKSLAKDKGEWESSTA
jgi:hypothetical protein